MVVVASEHRGKRYVIVKIKRRNIPGADVYFIQPDYSLSGKERNYRKKENKFPAFLVRETISWGENQWGSKWRNDPQRRTHDETWTNASTNTLVHARARTYTGDYIVFCVSYQVDKFSWGCLCTFKRKAMMAIPKKKEQEGNERAHPHKFLVFYEMHIKCKKARDILKQFHIVGNANCQSRRKFATRPAVRAESFMKSLLKLDSSTPPSNHIKCEL